MDNASIMALIAFIFSAILTAVISTIVKISLEKKFKKYNDDMRELFELRAEKERKERKEDVLNALKEELKPTNEKIDNMNETIDHIKHGTLSSLRNDILTCYYKCSEKGYRNDYDYKNIHELDEAYLELHGNSFIADIIKRFDNLPVKEEFKKEDKK